MNEITQNGKAPIKSSELRYPSIGTEIRANESAEQRNERVKKIAVAVSTILECLGEDVTREGILKTPMRYAEALMFFTVIKPLNYLEGL